IKIDTNEFVSVADATNAVERAISRNKVDFLVGGFRSEAVLVMQDIAMDNKKIFMGCGAAHPKLCTRVAKNYKRYKYWFRVTPINSRFLGKVDFILLATVAGIMRHTLGLKVVKVAVVAEKAVWADPIVRASKVILPKLGMKIVGVWRPSPVAKDVTAELTAMKRAGAHIIFTSFSSSVGITFARQWGELKIPAAAVGINVESQKDGFWKATRGMGNYTLTMSTYTRGVHITPKTIPWVEAYYRRFGEGPTYTAGTDEAIHVLALAITKAGSLDPDKIVPFLEKTRYYGTAGLLVFDKSHDVIWGPGYVTSLGVQWQNGKNLCVWPYKWQYAKGKFLTYKGCTPYKLPPWVVKYWKGRK
ncbi:MAG: ABC transporter substrate-binding protein, partial [Proteobacteria bacterium]|nr:ABC transporter substrate-binding protein [Pseudomonadota bacterium]